MVAPHHSASSLHAATTGPADEPDDVTLLCQIVEYNESAFTALYHRYMLRLRRFISRYVRQPELAEEVCHNVLLTVWQQAARFDPHQPFAPWLFGIARHKALSAQRQANAHAELPSTATTEDRSVSPEAHLRQQESARLMRQALAMLPPAYRTVITLAYYHDYTCNAIATHLGCPVGTVKTRLFQARHQLQALLQAQGLTPEERPGRAAVGRCVA